MDSDQLYVAKSMISAGQHLGANHLALMACLCIGWGENAMHSQGCNSSDHCGAFQLSSSLQSEHDYTDVYYWATRAYSQGFYSYGGIISMSVSDPSLSPGDIANRCQGAYADLATGAAYYDQYQQQAADTYQQITGGHLRISPPGRGGGPGSGAPAGVAIETHQLVTALAADDWSQWIGDGTLSLRYGAFNGYWQSRQARLYHQRLHTYTTHGGR